MNAIAANRTISAEIISALHEAGVRTVCICPGGRNAPLVEAFASLRGSFETVSFFEERSASFFALGRIRRDGAPVAVVTTSGTAAAELLPAMLEAFYAGLPLIAVTADRPRRLRGTGAPQTIDQTPLFAAAHARVMDIDAPGDIDALPLFEGPLHLNVCFGEPLVDGGGIAMTLGTPAAPKSPEPWMDTSTARNICSDFFATVHNPLILVSSLAPADAHALAPWLSSLSCPMYLEAISQLRGEHTLQEFSLHSGERILLTSECRMACDGVIRIGGIPTPRLWRELEDDPRPMLHISQHPLPGLARESPVVPLEHCFQIADAFVPQGERNEKLFARDRETAQRLEELLAQEPRSEAGLVRTLSEIFPADARVLLGNSLPVREWDLAALRTHATRTYFANRGVNGIDGLVSTTIGLAGDGRPTAAVLGDLSALYDLAGLWPARGGEDITLAVINNGGGMIFDRMFRNPAFLNAHGIRLRGWAEMFGWHYGVMHDRDDPTPVAGPRIVEVTPDSAATTRFSDAYSALWK